MSEPWHRRWLHALEDDASVPGTPMQVARIYADYASSRGGRWAHVSYAELVKQTHRTRDAIADAIEHLTSRGWLTLREPWKPGQEKHYDLVIPVQRTNRTAQSTGRHRRPPPWKRPAQQDGSVRPSRTEASGPADQSAQSTATVRPSRTEASGPADHTRLTSFTSLSVNGLHAALAAAVPGVTERETHLVRQLIGRRPGVVSVGAVMRREIADGMGPDLVAKVRGAEVRTNGNGSGPQTEACRANRHPRPTDPPCMGWCTCACHA